ncbi:MAG: formylglycine-generating enzyme family protein [Verrucomicrobiota bacterium]
MESLTMVRIPGGRFLMGCSEEDKFRNAHELPRHEVEVAAFELSVHPVSEEATGLPRVNVSWEEAKRICASLGTGYRLPSEAEWEYACRAGSDAPFPTGDIPDPSQVNYLYDESGNRIGPGRMLPNAWGEANPFGLHDMLGNVCEWVEDSWRESYESEAVDHGLKTIRGGGWDYMPRLLRASWRDFAPATVRRDNLGFRVARDLQDPR